MDVMSKVTLDGERIHMKTLRIFIAAACAVLLASGCAMVRTSPQELQTSTAGQRPVVERLVQATTSWDGALLPAYPEGQSQITILRITIPAGFQLDTHHHPVINAGVLIRGELTVVAADGKTLHLKAGDPIVELVDTLHYGVNRGAEPAEILVFYAGVADEPITVTVPSER